MEDDFATFEGRERARRQMAIREADQRCMDCSNELNLALEAAKQDPSNQERLESLKGLAQQYKTWGKSGPNSLGTRGSMLRSQAEGILKQFGWLEENK